MTDDAAEPKAYRTTDRVLITPGLRVFTYDCQWGTVLPEQWGRGGLTDPADDRFDGWFRVSLPGGGDRIYNGERMSTRDLDGRAEAHSRFDTTAP